MIRVSYLNFNLHKADGIAGFQTWFNENITGSNAVLDVHIDQSGLLEVVVWREAEE